MKNVLFIIHLFLSIVLSVFSIYWMVEDIFSVGKYSIGNVFLFTYPAFLVIPLAFIALGYLRSRPISNIYYSPLLISTATIIIGFVLFSFESTYPDYAFSRHFSYYQDIVGLMDENKIAVDQNGFILLPQKYKQVSSSGYVYVLTKGGEKTFYFEDGSDNFDIISWGYIYRPDNTPPTKDVECDSWRYIVPPTPNWYYCDVHEWVEFPEE